MMIDLMLGDCRERMATLEPESVDSIVTDPPYGLSFMGKGWDHGVPGSEFWTEALRVAKPGAHLLAFGGTRTFHRLACAIEDAGWEIRDCVMWVYGSGFPKSLDVSKAIDKAAGAEREVIGSRKKRGLGGSETFAQDAWTQAQRGVIDLNITAPATDAAKQWQGWGTALKPAWEPVIVARKPLVGTVAANVLKHGTGAINVDGCRVPHAEECRMMAPSQKNIDNPSDKYRQAGRREAVLELKPEGRWPANVIHDGSEEVVALFPVAKGQQGAVTGSEPSSKTQDIYGSFAGRQAAQPRGDNGSAARFFYCAKASRKDRNEGCEALIEKALNWSSGTKNPGSFQSEGTKKAAKNNHPTVKPTELMRYLCRLVTPPGGVVLDPFMGSGSTGKAATIEGFDFIGIELEPEYFKIAQARIGFVEAICK